VSDSLEGLSEAKRTLLARELARRRAAASADSILPRPAGEPPMLSMAQRRLWFLDRIQPGQPTYNATLTMRIEGLLDVDALHRSLDLVVARHESLRTVGIEVDGRPVGRLLEIGVRWRVIRGVAEADLSDLLKADAREPFDLGADVMLRASLYPLSDQLHVLILVLHHIATDGWSRGIMFSEVTANYNRLIRGEQPVNPPLRVQYGDYARWQEAAMAQGRLARDEQFWQEHLAGADFSLELPTDLPRPRVPDHRGDRVEMDRPKGSVDAIRSLARSEGATFFMAMMAVTGAFLSGLTDQDDVLLGSPVANRQHPELEGLIGFFVNTLVFRVRLDGDPTFSELLRRCRQSAIASFAHQDMPFDRLVEVINPRRVPGRNPIFQVNYRMQGAAPPPPQLDGLRVTRMVTGTQTARFELALGFVDQAGPLRGYVEYSHGLFRRGTIDAWQGAVAELVDLVLRDPDLRTSKLGPLVRAAVDRRRDAAASAAPVSTRGIRRRA
jgi:hypothetical protein